MLRGGNVKNDEQGASSSQMAAARLLDTISRLTSTVAEANDAVSAYTKVHMSVGMPRPSEKECSQV